MSESDEPIFEAVEALRARGHTVEMWSDDFALRLVDGQSLTEAELPPLPSRVGLVDFPTDKLQ